MKRQTFLFQMVVTLFISAQYLWKYGNSNPSDNIGTLYTFLVLLDGGSNDRHLSGHAAFSDHNMKQQYHGNVGCHKYFNISIVASYFTCYVFYICMYMLRGKVPWTYLTLSSAILYLIHIKSVISTNQSVCFKHLYCVWLTFTSVSI
jgi:hypothetical protein